MRKKLNVALITLGILFFLYAIVFFSGMLKTYHSPTPTNEPNLKMNVPFFASNLVNPKIGDFVCYKYVDNIFGKSVRVNRICGMENDIIEIKNGVVFLNGKNIDKGNDHIHFYKLSKQEFEEIKRKETFTEANYVIEINENNIQIGLEDRMAEKYKLTSKRIINEKGIPDRAIQSVFKYNWNKDNFGPIRIPEGKIFVIGDNRDNSEDSRYTGFVNKSDIVGVVISN